LVSFVVWKRFFAPLKDMTVRAAERLQIFLSCNCVIPSEVEESLDVNPIMGRNYNFWTYVVTNKKHSVLYIGVTNSLSRRTWQHHEGDRLGFAADYRCTKLIYYEWYRDIRDAIARESQLKKWSRAKKVTLINRLDPSWRDLGADVLQDR
jgi:putative endonuclease